MPQNNGGAGPSELATIPALEEKTTRSAQILSEWTVRAFDGRHRFVDLTRSSCSRSYCVLVYKGQFSSTNFLELTPSSLDKVNNLPVCLFSTYVGDCQVCHTDSHGYDQPSYGQYPDGLSHFFCRFVGPTLTSLREMTLTHPIRSRPKDQALCFHWKKGFPN